MTRVVIPPMRLTWEIESTIHCESPCKISFAGIDHIKSDSHFSEVTWRKFSVPLFFSKQTSKTRGFLFILRWEMKQWTSSFLKVTEERFLNISKKNSKLNEFINTMNFFLKNIFWFFRDLFHSLRRAPTSLIYKINEKK